MARQRRRSSNGPDGAPKPRKRSRDARPRTDLSAFLAYPLATIDDDAFDALCQQMRDQLAPKDETEEGLVRGILWSFQGIRRGRRAVELGVSGAERYLKTMLESFRMEQQGYDLIRRIFEENRPTATPSAPPSSEVSPPEPPPVPDPGPEPVPETTGPIDEPEAEEDPVVGAIEATAPGWRTLIAIVPSRDARWPVLDQLDILVDDVLSLRDRGTSEEEILERFPSLTPADLAACYACEADGYRGPLEPPYPEDIAVLEYGPDND